MYRDSDLMINSQDLIFFVSFSLLENNCAIVAGKFVTWSENWTLQESLGTV